MMLRRILLVMLTAVATVLGVMSAAPAAMADDVITSSFDTEAAHRGDTVNLTVTFTNPETTDVTFTYLTVNTTYDTEINGTRFTYAGCTGEITDCEHYTVPIAPGATRTMRWAFEIGADSACGQSKDLSFFIYSYRESAAGASELISYTTRMNVLC